MCNGYFQHTKSCLKTKDNMVTRRPSDLFACPQWSSCVLIQIQYSNRKKFFGTKYLHALRINEKKNKMWMGIVVLLSAKVDKTEVLFAVWVQYLLISSSRCCFLIPKPLNDRVLNL